MAIVLAVRNTFVDIVQDLPCENEKTSVSCPAELFGGRSEVEEQVQPCMLSGLANVARAFSRQSCGLTRQALEDAGHLAPLRGAYGIAKLQDLEDGTSTTTASEASEPAPDCSLGAESLAASLPETEFDWPLSPATPDGSQMSSPRITSDMQRLAPPAPALSPIQTTFPVAPLPAPASRPAPCMPAPAVPAPALPAEAAPPPPPTEMAAIAFYRVAYLGGIQLRTAPAFDAPRTKIVVACNQIIAVSQELRGADGRVYLRLADGSGWAFDDGALHPQDPSVRRGSWRWGQERQPPLESLLPIVATPPSPSGQPPSWEPTVPSCVADVLSSAHKRRRRKRGGVRRNKGKRAAAAAAAAAAGEAGEATVSDDEDDASDMESLSQAGSSSASDQAPTCS